MDSWGDLRLILEENLLSVEFLKDESLSNV